MKKTAYMLVLAVFTAGVAQASLFTDDFSNDTITITDNKEIVQSELGVGNWGVSSPVEVIADGTLNIDLDAGSATKNLTRGACLWLDTSAWVENTQVTVSFDILNWSANDAITMGELFSGAATSSVDLLQNSKTDIVTITKVGTTDLASNVFAADDSYEMVFDFTTSSEMEFIGVAFSGYTTVISTESNFEFGVDNVIVTQVVPEPGTIGMLGLGAAVAAMMRKRKKQAASE